MAAEELETVLSACVAESLTIEGDKDVRFHVGDTKLAVEKRLSAAHLKDEEWVVKSFGRDVVVNGGGSHGALYAVSHFLEDVCGVRFWNDTETDFPKEKVRALPALDLRGHPVLRYRDIYRGSSTNATPRFAIRRRLNRNGESPIPREFGGEFNYGPPYHCHTFDRYIPWGRYGKEHPEWFSLWEGKRVGGITGGQLCLTNPEVRKLLQEKLLASIAAGEAAAKDAGVPPPRLYDLSQNDAYGRYCQCEKCAAEVGKYGHSGFYLNVINAIADEVAKKYPHVFLTTLAYEFTEPPPKGGVRPRDNVIVKLCDTRSNEAASLAEPCNAEFRGFLESWGKIAPNLLVWDYAGVYVNPAVLFPFASEFGLGETIRMFHENHVMGVFIEHPGAYDMHDLKYYLESKLFENPQLETKALIIDFMTGYFGAAARPVLKARRHLDRIRRERNGYITFMPPCEKFDFVRLDDLKLMASFWDEAEAAVKDDPPRLARVKRCRGSQDALLRFRLSDPKVEDGRFVFDPVAFDCGKGPARIVKDGKSPAGEAVRLPKEPKDLFVGLYAPTEGNHTFEATFPPAKDGEYAWYEFRDVRIPKPAQNVFYFSKRWNPHLGIYHPDLNGNTCTLRVYAKFTDAIYIARAEFIPEVENK